MSIIVIGFGVSGMAAARLAKQCGYDVSIVDEKTSEPMLKKRLEFELEGIRVELGVQSFETSGIILI